MKMLPPTTGLTALRREMDRLLDRFWDVDPIEVPTLGEWTPLVDVSENKDLFTVKMEIPGIDPRDVEILLRDQVLTIQGEKKQEAETKEENFYHMERTYGSFTRRIRLPHPVDTKKVNAVFKNGVLMVTLTKIQGAEGTHIPIKSE